MPVVTLLLIGANLAAAFALLVNPEIAYDFGFRPNQPRLGAVFTSLFLHANLIHLLGNMVFLAAVGAAVELATGSLRFAAVYFVSGVVGVGAHYAMTRHLVDGAPFIGASGCIAGCAGYYSFRYTRLRVPVAPHFAASVLMVTVAWAVLQVIGAFVKLGDGVGTAFWAHLGGLGAGVLLSFIFRAPDLEQVKLGHAVLDQMNSRGPAAVVMAASRHLEQHPGDNKALWELVDAYSSLDERDKQAGVLLQLLEDDSVAEQVEVIRRLAKIGRITRIPVLRRLQLADRIRPTHRVLARALLKSVVEGPVQEPQRPDAMLTLAALDWDEQPHEAKEILAELERTYPLHASVELARKRGWLV